MSFRNLVKFFFHDKKISYNDNSSEYNDFSDTNSLTPIILALFNWSLKGTKLDNKVVTFTLHKQNKSLLGLCAKDIDFHDSDCVRKLLKETPFYQAIVDNAKNMHDENLCITHFIKTSRFRDELLSDGDEITIEQVIHNIFSLNYKVDIAPSVLNDVVKIYEQNLALKEEIKSAEEKLIKESTSSAMETAFNNVRSTEVVEKKLTPSFNIKEHYVTLEDNSRELLNEITVVSTAYFLFKNSNTSTSKIEYANLKLPEVNFDIFFAAILNVPYVLDRFAQVMSCYHYQIIFPKPVYKNRQNIFDIADIRTFDSDKGNTSNWYAEAKRPLFNLTFAKSIEHCLNKSFNGTTIDLDQLVDTILNLEDEYIHDFKAMNDCKNRSVKSVKVTQLLQEELSSKIIGQRSAIEGLCEGYLSSCIHRNEGPRMIYTFAGPSGVGKTYSANNFAELLNKVEHSGYTFNTFNMEHFSHERDSMKLMGSGSQYTDSSLGLLTNMVRAQPRQIFLFDEIEKAHPNVIQSLLSILDSGQTVDSTSCEKVNFTQAIIIFTTNLGQDLFTKNNQNHQVNVFDVLRTSKNSQTGQGLSPEFVSRLSKGCPALFSNLKVNHFIKTAESKLNDDETGLSGITFNWPENFCTFLLKSLSPEINMRLIESALSELQANILQKTIPFLDDNKENITINVNLDDNLLEKNKTKILVLDDDPRVFEATNSSLTNEDIVLCSNTNDIPNYLEKFRPSTILIDINTLDYNSFSELVDQLTLQNPQLILFTYQLESDLKHTTYNYNHEEIREHFSLNTVSFIEELSAMFKRVNHYIETETSLDKMRKKNKMLSYKVSVDMPLESIEVTFHDLQSKQLVHTEDLREGDLFSHSTPNSKLADVIGLDRAKKRLNDVIGWLKQPSKLNNFGVSVPAGYLFAGPPGTGKTLLAKAVAGECDLPFFSVSAAELSSPHHGGTTQNIKKLFNTARKYAPAIVFIDEIDAIASARTANTSGAAQDANLTVNALLTEMDGFDDKSQIFVLAATNHPTRLDSAITRPGRFDETIYCDLPNKEAREVFFNRYAQQHHLNWSEAELLNLVALARGMSPAQIQQVLKEAIQFAVSNDVQLTEDIVESAMIRVRFGSPSEHLFLSGDEKRKTAYHEAGHLLAHHFLFPKHHIDFITIEPRNQALGFVATRQPDEYESYSKITIMYKLQMLLAGRVAEKLCTGSADEISTGASSDIEKATQLAMHAVYQGGIEPSVGPLNVGMLTRYEESDLLANAQNAVKRWIDTAEQDIETLLSNNYKLLEIIAETLIDKESLMGHEISKLLDK